MTKSLKSQLVPRRLRQPSKDWTQADLTVSGEGAYSPHETAQFAGPSVMPLGTWLLGTVLATGFAGFVRHRLSVSSDTAGAGFVLVM